MCVCGVMNSITTGVKTLRLGVQDLKRMMCGEEVNVRIKKFGGTNYKYWRMQNKDFISMGRGSTFLCWIRNRRAWTMLSEIGWIDTFQV